MTPRDVTPEPATRVDPELNEQYPRLKGRCPSCGAESLFRGFNGYVTCSVIGCKNPGAAHDVLVRAVPPTTPPAEITWLKRHSAHGDVEGNADRYECKTCGGTFWRPPTAEREPPQMNIDGMCRNGHPHYCPNCDNSFIWNPPKPAPEPSSAALEALIDGLERASISCLANAQAGAITTSAASLLNLSDLLRTAAIQLRASSPSGAPQ